MVLSGICMDRYKLVGVIIKTQSTIEPLCTLSGLWHKHPVAAKMLKNGKFHLSEHLTTSMPSDLSAQVSAVRTVRL